MNNARIHKTDKIIKLVKENKLFVFTFSPYSPQLNKIEHTFGTLKNIISVSKPKTTKFKHIIIEEIKKIRTNKK